MSGAARRPYLMLFRARFRHRPCANSWEPSSKFRCFYFKHRSLQKAILTSPLTSVTLQVNFSTIKGLSPQKDLLHNCFWKRVAGLPVSKSCTDQSSKWNQSDSSFGIIRRPLKYLNLISEEQARQGAIFALYKVMSWASRVFTWLIYRILQFLSISNL